MERTRTRRGWGRGRRGHGFVFGRSGIRFFAVDQTMALSRLRSRHSRFTANNVQPNQQAHEDEGRTTNFLLIPVRHGCLSSSMERTPAHCRSIALLCKSYDRTDEYGGILNLKCRIGQSKSSLCERTGKFELGANASEIQARLRARRNIPVSTQSEAR